MAHRQLCTCSKPRPTSAACRTRIPSRPGADVPKPAAREQVPHEHGFYSSRIAPKRRGTNEMPRARACRRCPNQYRSSRRQPAHLQTSPRTAGCAPPGAKAADCAPLGAKEAAREAASDPDFPSHAALLADPGGGGSPVEGWLSRLGSYPSVSGAAQNGEWGGCSPGFRRRSARTSTPPTRFCGRGALPLQDPLRVAALAARSGWTAGR